MMVSVEPCEKHDLSCCADCANPVQTGVRASDTSEFGPSFPARFDGRCSLDKSHSIETGDIIRADGDGGYVCPRSHI